MQAETLDVISRDEERRNSDILYKLDDVPPWYLSFFLGLQHYLTMLTGALVVPFILSNALCIPNDSPYGGYIVSATFFASGLATFLQATFGCRLPIIQGPSIAFLVPVLSILSLPRWKCPSVEVIRNMTEEEVEENLMMRMREVQGAVIIGAIIEVLVGFTGLIGFMLRFITPLSIVPTITLIGLSLFKEASRQASENWLISGFTMILLIVFSQYLAEINVPVCSYSKNSGWKPKKFYIFKLFPVILTIFISWGLCSILTIVGVFSESNSARTDVKLSTLHKAPWVRVPYPGQFGIPTFNIGPVLGITAGVIASTLESVGDYYACTKLIGAPALQIHAVNRGIMTEGFGCAISGLCGAGIGVTSFSQNIAAIAITRVGSRRVIQFAAVIITGFGMIGKFGALFTVIPSPILGGIFCIIFAYLTGVGFSSLQYVNLNSSRNLFILGFSMFMGLCIPSYLEEHPESIYVENDLVNQILETLLKSSMLIGGFCGCLLDNTVPASEKDRGIVTWRTEMMPKEVTIQETESQPDNLLGRMTTQFSFLKYIPICPTYKN